MRAITRGKRTTRNERGECDVRVEITSVRIWGDRAEEMTQDKGDAGGRRYTAPTETNEERLIEVSLE